MIAFEHVEKRYGSTCALRDVTLRIPPGVIYGVIGPNGAGKTTLLRLIVGLARPTRGRVTVEAGEAGRAGQASGEDVRRAPAPLPAPPAVASIGYLPQHVDLNGLATSRETLQLFARLRALPPDAVECALQAAGLQAHAERRVGVLSGGLRQRLGLAIACLGDSRILLLDEPSAGLDPRAAVELRREMRRLADADRTVVVCSHSLPELESVCDRVAVLLEGRLVLEGPLDELKRGRPDVSLDDLFMEATA